MDDIDQPLGWVHNNAWLVLKLQLIVRNLDIIFQQMTEAASVCVL